MRGSAERRRLRRMRMREHRRGDSFCTLELEMTRKKNSEKEKEGKKTERMLYFLLAKIPN